MRTRLRRSLAGKLLLAHLLVIVTGSATLALVALAIAPGIFHDQVGGSGGVARHVDKAFGAAVLIALAVAIGAAVLTALAVSVFLLLRIVRPIRALAEAAERIAKGAYAARVPATGSDEIAVLGGAFNDMATALESAERKRRELLTDVAHELRTPLATVEGYLEGLADGIVPANRATWSLLQAETGRLRRLVDDLAKVSRAEERQLDLHSTPSKPGLLVAAALRAAAPGYAVKGVALETKLDRRLPSVDVDPDRIAEVLANVLDNALRHTPTGGRVEVAAAGRGQQVELTVADTGEGIAPEHLERVFERFFRADLARTRTAGGSGIGLAIARAIVEAHGGHLHAESEGPGLGARFVITLPASAGSPIGARASEQAHEIARDVEPPPADNRAI